VDVSVDNGATWHAATFIGPHAPYAWRQWQYVANLTHRGSYTVLARAADAMETRGTLSNKFFMDEQYGEHMAANLLSISDSLASILKKVDRGDGTLGALINDRSVYDSLAAVSEGMRKSALVGWYLQRKAEKAAREAQLKEKQGQKP
jgi:hypothetical protein